jgi:hypothetical protein
MKARVSLACKALEDADAFTAQLAQPEIRSEMLSAT